MTFPDSWTWHQESSTAGVHLKLDLPATPGISHVLKSILMRVTNIGQATTQFGLLVLVDGIQLAEYVLTTVTNTTAETGSTFPGEGYAAPAGSSVTVDPLGGAIPTGFILELDVQGTAL